MWDEVADWRMYAPSGEPWFGFNAVRQLDGLPPEILLIPLRGHTEGHAGVAVQTGFGWLLHVGDAYQGHGVIAAEAEQRQHDVDDQRDPARRQMALPSAFESGGPR